MLSWLGLGHKKNRTTVGYGPGPVTTPSDLDTVYAAWALYIAPIALLRMHFPILFLVENSQWFTSIDSHAWPVGLALTPLCVYQVQGESCRAQCAQGRGISVGFQRREGGGICNASEIIAAFRSRWTGVVLICKHSGRGRARTDRVMKVCFYGHLPLKISLLCQGEENLCSCIS